MKKIAFINNKGGVSKTASSIVVANILADEFNKKVLLVDIDPQRNTTSRFSETNYFDLFENLMEDPDGDTHTSEEKTIEDILLNPKLDLHCVIQQTNYKNIDILPARLTLSNAEERLRSDFAKGPVQTRLKSALKQVDNEYDYCIIDCGPSVALLNVNALAAAEDVYIPIRPDGDSLVGMAITRNLVETISEWNSDIEIAGVFFTCYNPNENMSTQMYDYLQDFLKDYDFPLLPIKIGNSTNVKKSSVVKASLSEIDPKGRVTNQYRKLCEYIIAPNKKEFLKKLSK